MPSPNTSSTPSSAVTATAGHNRPSAVARALVAGRAGREWCLFLDRDGVINRRIIGDYVRDWSQFEWLPGAREAINILSRWAPHIAVVTNQQGIGKGLMTDDDLAVIHRHMQDEVARGGREFDAIQVCPHLESAGCACRKPRPGLVLDWLADNPGCDPRLSLIVGDSVSDLNLARNVAARVGECAAVHITSGAEVGEAALSAASLWDFAVEVAAARGEDVL